MVQGETGITQLECTELEAPLVLATVGGRRDDLRDADTAWGVQLDAYFNVDIILR